MLNLWIAWIEVLHIKLKFDYEGINGVLELQFVWKNLNWMLEQNVAFMKELRTYQTHYFWLNLAANNKEWKKGCQQIFNQNFKQKFQFLNILILLQAVAWIDWNFLNNWTLNNLHLLELKLKLKFAEFQRLLKSSRMVFVCAVLLNKFQTVKKTAYHSEISNCI